MLSRTVRRPRQLMVRLCLAFDIVISAWRDHFALLVGMSCLARPAALPPRSVAGTLKSKAGATPAWQYAVTLGFLYRVSETGTMLRVRKAGTPLPSTGRKHETVALPKHCGVSGQFGCRSEGKGEDK